MLGRRALWGAGRSRIDRTIVDASAAGARSEGRAPHRRIRLNTMNPPRSGAPDGRGARLTAHELARYEALFAARTRSMKSSAMREMMALTERPDVISLAGGLPDTSTFAPELFAQLFASIAEDSTARALQY